MTRTAPMSSMIARAARNTLAPIGARGAIRESAPKASDIRSHRNAPAARAESRRVENPVDCRGHNHAANRTRDRQRGLPARGQLASEQLAFDFEADQKKEHGHESVVDPVAEA